MQHWTNGINFNGFKLVKAFNCPPLWWLNVNITIFIFSIWPRTVQTCTTASWNALRVLTNSETFLCTPIKTIILPTPTACQTKVLSYQITLSRHFRVRVSEVAISWYWTINGLVYGWCLIGRLQCLLIFNDHLGIHVFIQTFREGWTFVATIKFTWFKF